MRPTPGAASASSGRSRGPSFSDNDATPMPTQYPSQGGGMTYFLADEKTLESSTSNIPTSHPRPRYGVKPGMYGVESIESTISSLGASRQPPSPRIPASKKSPPKPQSRKSDEDFQRTDWSSQASLDHSRDVSPYDRLPRRLSQTISQPLTPLFSASPAPESITSSAHSRRGSDLDSLTSETISQVISESEDDTELQSEETDNGSAPQLVMPSIKMPSRRPFTERGKNMGRLKVMVAGDSGIGKTSLIKAIVQACEDIVHVDPLSTAPLSVSDETLRKSRSKSRSKSRDASVEQSTTEQLTEVYASTRPYPSWWSDFDEGRVLRRRRSVGDTVLERNLCFVDSPGYGNGTSCMETITPVINYIEEQMGRTASTIGMSDSDLISMLSGNGGSHVDVVLYVISKKLKPVDFEYLRQLSPLTNIIPVLAQADRFNDEQINLQKRQVLSELHTSGIRPFLFGMSFEEALNTTSPCAPWAVSSIATSDSDNMDASVLMSPDYIQPLLNTDLQELVSLIFERDSISWLRHSAAKKILAWQKNSSPSPSPLYTPAIPIRSGSLSSSASSVLRPIGLSNSYALARVADHTQREERYAQVRLAKWANELQRSIENERARFEALCRGERAIWLTERLGECVQDGTLIPLSHARTQSPSDWSPGLKQNNGNALVKKGTYSPAMRGVATFDPRDPLGLLSFDKEMRQKGWVTLQVLGGAGVVGGVILWLTRTWSSEGWSWGVEWNRLGMDW